MNDPKPLSPLASGALAPRRASGTGAKPSIAALSGPPLSPSAISRRPSLHDPLPRSRLGSITEGRPMRSALLELDSASAKIGQSASDALSDSALDEDDSDEEPHKSDDDDGTVGTVVTSPEPSQSPLSATPVNGSKALPKDQNPSTTGTTAESAETVTLLPSQPAPLSVSSSFVHPSDLAAQLASHPKLAALRAPAGLSMTPLASGSGAPSPARSAPQSPGVASAVTKSSNYFPPVSAPILANPKCSGYFVEPVGTLLSPSHAVMRGLVSLTCYI